MVHLREELRQTNLVLSARFRRRLAFQHPDLQGMASCADQRGEAEHSRSASARSIADLSSHAFLTVCFGTAVVGALVDSGLRESLEHRDAVEPKPLLLISHFSTVHGAPFVACLVL